MLSVERDFAYQIEDGVAMIIGYEGTSGDIIIPSSMAGFPTRSIRDFCFYQCTALTSVVIEEGIEVIGEHAFSGCTSLKSASIPDSVTHLGASAFQDCTSMSSMNLGTSIDTIQPWTFCNCISLKTLAIPNSAKSIEAMAFSECNALTSLSIGSGVEMISENAFMSCSSLTNISVDGGNTHYTSIDGVLYDKSASTLICYPGGRVGAYAIPDSVNTIGNSAFRGSSLLTSITLGTKVTSIGDSAFQLCSSLNSVSFQGRVKPKVGIDWIDRTGAGIEGHAESSSDFPPPEATFHGLKMGSILERRTSYLAREDGKGVEELQKKLHPIQREH